MNTELLNKLIEWGVTYGMQLLTAILILVIGFWVSNKLIKTLSNVMKRRNIEESLRSFLCSFLNVLVKALVIIIVLTRVGVEMTSVVALLGAAGLAVGMALSGTLQNFAGGIIILLFKPFKVGDYVETPSVSGTVSEIKIFSTVLKTPDNKTIFAPNGALANGSLTNYTKEEKRRLDMSFNVAYGEDVARVKEVLMGIMKADSRVLNEPAPEAMLTALDGSWITVSVRMWVANGDYWKLKFDLYERVYNTFNEAKIEFPFPQIQVHTSK